jgi:enoyl-CoA hydratase/carnithine racemase
MAFPESYATYSLPDIKFAHHPATSASVTSVILVILNRPDAHNAFTPAMASSLVSAFGLLSRDDRVRAVILTGCDQSNRIFCAGADLHLGFDTEGETRTSHRDGGGTVSLAIHRCRKPVIAALNGSAVGVGITMTLPCAIRVASAQAKIGFVFARRAIAMEAASSFFLPRIVGTGRALHLVTTGEVVPAGSRLLDGLFSEVVAPEQVLPTALRIAEDVARNTSHVATAVMRDLIYRGTGSAEETHLLDSSLLFDIFNSPDVKEGVRAFMEKRSPNFKADERPKNWPWWDDEMLKSKL